MNSNDYLSLTDIDLNELGRLISVKTDANTLSWASDVISEVVFYEGDQLRKALKADLNVLKQIQVEWHRVLLAGSGVIIIKNAFANTALLDQVNQVFQKIIDQERHLSQGDHFAAPGANDRIWNAHEKLAVTAPELYVQYYANELIAHACSAWLGPRYQMTAQVNSVNPGGKAQMPHRDYHLGFMTPKEAVEYPRSVHSLSPHLTLQGAVAHVDMPLESGPTSFLPHSQKFLQGYLLAECTSFQALYAQHKVQLPLNKGDAIFFNPAVLHAASANNSACIQRIANLLQVSSAFGRPMEYLDRVKMIRAIYPSLKQCQVNRVLTSQEIQAVIAATADGYAFPTNLDLDPPVDGIAPQSQQDIVCKSLAQNRSMVELSALLAAQRCRSRGLGLGDQAS